MPLIIKNKSKNEIKKFEDIGADIGLLFQVADDLIDYKGSLSAAGKKTGKDKKKGKATLISLLGYKNTIKYANDLILKKNNKLKKYGPKSKQLSQTLNYILNREKKIEFLDKINFPSDLKISESQLQKVADELREELIDAVSVTGNIRSKS